MNIIFVCDSMKINGGSTTVALRDAELLKRNGINVTFFTAEAVEMSDFYVSSTQQNEFLNYDNPIIGAFCGLYNLKAASAMDNLLNEYDPNDTIVHFHSWLKRLSPSIIRVCAKRKFMCMFTAHDYFLLCPNGGLYNFYSDKICKVNPLSIRCMLTNCDKRNYAQKLYRVLRHMLMQMFILSNYGRNAVVYVSNFEKDIYCAYGYNRFKYSYVLNNRISRNKSNVKKISKEKKYYIYIGRVDKEKGIELFCKAMHELSLEAVVIGSGQLESELIKKYQNDYNIRFVGWQARERWYKWLDSAKAIIIPSLLYETSVLIGQEVLDEYDLPIIVSDKCAATEYIKKENGHYYFKNGNIESLKEQITLVEKNIIENGQSDIINSGEGQTSDEYVTKLIKIYNLLISSRFGGKYENKHI